MAQITINIPDAHVNRVLDAFAGVFGFDPLAVPPVTKAQFARNKVRDYIKEIVIRFELEDRKREATEELQTDVDAIGIN